MDMEIVKCTTVTCTTEALTRFVRGEILYDELLGIEADQPEFDSYEVKCEVPYKIMYEDLKTAIKNMIALERTPEEFFCKWYEPVAWRVGELVNIADLIGYPEEGSVSIIMELPYVYFPKNQTRLALSLIQTMENDAQQYTMFDMDSEEYEEILREYLERMDNLEYNKEHHISEWKFTKRQKKDIVFEYEEDKLAALGKEKQNLYKVMLEELCADGDIEAIRIKGYACYGTDHPVYECDWEASRDCMLYLIDHGDDEMQAGAANTLGYIYYYGRCNNGIPEYDLAFKYFSLASFYGFYEATYKIGDMLAEGKGIPMNKNAALRLYESTYYDCLIKFQEGDREQSFADAALRIAKAYQKGIGVYPSSIIAYYYYLQAKVAIEERMRQVKFFGDEKVFSEIERGLSKMSGMLKEEGIDVNASEVTVVPRKIINMLMDDRHPISLEVEKGEEEYKLVFTRMEIGEFDYAKKVLLTVPEVSYCKKTQKLVLHLPIDEIVMLKDDQKKVVFDQVKYDEGCMKFYRRKKRQAMIADTGMIFRTMDQ